MRRTPAVFLLSAIPGALVAAGSVAVAQLPRPNEVVEPRAYVSLAPVPRGRAFEVAVVAKIRSGFHVNAHRVTLDYLIPTTLEAEISPGLQTLATSYPPGRLRRFKFSAEKLSVYESRFTVRLKMRALPDAPLGPQKLALALRYQACNDEVCLPPTKVQVNAEFEVAAAGATTRPAHPEIFSARPRPETPSPQ